MIFSKTRLTYAVIAASLLVGCGGGGGDSGTVSGTAEGLYKGTIGTGQEFGTIILEDGTYYGIYSSSTNSSSIGGFLQGTGTSNNGNFTSNNLRTFDVDNDIVADGSLSARFVSKSTISGTTTFGSNSSTFSGNYEPLYDQAPSLSLVAGSYRSSNSVFTITSSGSISGSIDSCPFTGTIAPRPKGNSYAVNVVTGSSCGGIRLNGISVLDSTGTIITAVVISSDRTSGAALRAAKP